MNKTILNEQYNSISANFQIERKLNNTKYMQKCWLDRTNRPDFGPGCVQLWLRSAELHGEYRYKN